jgi:hypothetical protein
MSHRVATGEMTGARTSPTKERRPMSHAFLSAEWFDAVDSLRAEIGDPPVPAAMADLKLNINVTGGPDGDKELSLQAGQFVQGPAEGAATKLTVPFDVAKSMFIEGNQQAAMQAFMSGQIKVEGDMSKLMAMQGGAPSPEQQAFTERLKGITA